MDEESLKKTLQIVQLPAKDGISRGETMDGRPSGNTWQLGSWEDTQNYHRCTWAEGRRGT